jgi:hypothetical protein
LFVCILPLVIGRGGGGWFLGRPQNQGSTLLQNPAAELRCGYVSREGVEKQQMAGESNSRRSNSIFPNKTWPVVQEAERSGEASVVGDGIYNIVG